MVFKKSIRLVEVVALLLVVVVYQASCKKVCYGKYGCFSDDPPFTRSLVPLPQPPDEIGLSYHVMTRKEPIGNKPINDHDVTLLKDSSYDGGKRTVIIVHGWLANSAKQWQLEMGRALITREDVNVILASWKEGAREFYTISVANTRLVGAQITELIKFLNDNTGNTPASFHVIGFSLGAQIAGYVGRRLQHIKLARISGLDPASLYYKDEHIDVRLDPSDASFVDVIHTNSPFVGTPTRSGHIDFWPNGGEFQRGCSVSDILEGKNIFKCHHHRARNFYTDSITSSTPFQSYPCSNWDQFTRGNCMSCGTGNECPEMGYNAIKYKGKTNGGDYYLYTNEDRPYAVHRYVLVTFKTRRGWLGGGHNPRIRIYGDKGNTGKIKLEPRDLKEGSTETFIAPIKADLGTLRSIDVWHLHKLAPVDGWRLEKVTVKFVESHERYTACYGYWSVVFFVPNNEKLVEGNC